MRDVFTVDIKEAGKAEPACQVLKVFPLPWSQRTFNRAQTPITWLSHWTPSKNRFGSLAPFCLISPKTGKELWVEFLTGNRDDWVRIEICWSLRIQDLYCPITHFLIYIINIWFVLSDANRTHPWFSSWSNPVIINAHDSEFLFHYGATLSLIRWI